MGTNVFRHRIDAEIGFMSNLIIPSDLFDDLMENLIECLNNAINEGNTDLEQVYRIELHKCNEIKKEETRNE